MFDEDTANIARPLEHRFVQKNIDKRFRLSLQFLQINFDSHAPIMTKLQSKLETGANAAIILVAILIAGVLVQRYFFPSNATADDGKPPGPSLGSRVTLADFDWEKQPQTVLLVLQKGCIYCTESAPFYQRLLKDGAGKNVRFVAVLPQPKAVSDIYLADLGIPGIEMREATLQSLDVRGTPTLIVANEKGEVVNTWTGKLRPEREQEVYKQLQF